MGAQDPVSAGLLDLMKANYNRRQAELDADMARAQEQLVGRTAVPNVMAQLQQRAEKEAAKREKIQQSGTGAAPQSMLPPMTDTTGQTSGRGAGQALAAAGDLLDQTLGGGGIKRSGAPGAVAGAAGTTPNLVAGMEIASPGSAAAAQALRGGQAPVAPPRPGPAPGSIVPENVPLSATERGFSGLAGVVALAGRNPAGAQYLQQAVTGEKTVGYQQTPTVEEQAKTLAGPLSVFQERMLSDNPLRRQGAEEEYQKRLEQISQSFPPEIVAQAQVYATDIRMQREETRYYAQEAPLEQMRRRDNEIESIIEERGVDYLKEQHPGLYSIWERSGPKAATTNVQIMMPATQTKLEGNLAAGQDTMQRINQMRSAMQAYPEFFQTGSALMQAQREQRERLPKSLQVGPTAISEGDRIAMRNYSRVDQAFSGLNVDVVRPILGATMTDKELELVLPMLPQKDRSYTVNLQKLDDFQYYAALSQIRYSSNLKEGVDPRYSGTFADIRKLASQMVDMRQGELEKSGLAADAASAQVEREFMDAYGLDVERLKSTGATGGF